MRRTVRLEGTETDGSDDFVLWYPTDRIFVVYKERVAKPPTLLVIVP